MKFTAIQQQPEENKSTALQIVASHNNQIEVVKKHGVINMNQRH